VWSMQEGEEEDEGVDGEAGLGAGEWDLEPAGQVRYRPWGTC
jgi:hypothetical protein